MAHVIRLRGPWHYELQSGGGRSAGIVQMPCNLASIVEPGAELSLARRFHRPTGLEADNRVWLVIDPASVVSAITLNTAQMPREGDDGRRAEITARLRAQNTVTLRILGREDLPAGAVSVWLEIESGP